MKKLHPVRGRYDTTELLALRSPEETLRGRPQPQQHRQEARPARSPAPAAATSPRGGGQRDLGAPHFPASLRNNFAAVIFALTVQGAVFGSRAPPSPAPSRHDFPGGAGRGGGRSVSAAPAAPRAPTRRALLPPRPPAPTAARA